MNSKTITKHLPYRSKYLQHLFYYSRVTFKTKPSNKNIQNCTITFLVVIVNHRTLYHRCGRSEAIETVAHWSSNSVGLRQRAVAVSRHPTGCTYIRCYTFASPVLRTAKKTKINHPPTHKQT